MAPPEKERIAHDAGHVRSWEESALLCNDRMCVLQLDDLIKKFPDLDPFLLKKWERIFNVFFDRNASAEVDWGDFYLVVRVSFEWFKRKRI